MSALDDVVVLEKVVEALELLRHPRLGKASGVTVFPLVTKVPTLGRNHHLSRGD
jgi:hypothetical protein